MGTSASYNEYKGGMRLPLPLHGRLTKLSALTGRSLNDLVVEATLFLCALAESSDKAEVPVPDSVISARAITAHRAAPTVISMADHHAAIRPRAGDKGDDSLRIAEGAPDPPKAQARRAK